MKLGSTNECFYSDFETIASGGYQCVNMTSCSKSAPQITTATEREVQPKNPSHSIENEATNPEAIHHQKNDGIKRNNGINRFKEFKFNEINFKTSKGLQRSGQCQRCGKILNNVRPKLMRIHRRVCDFSIDQKENHPIQEGEILVSVSTEPFQNSIEEPDDDNNNSEINDGNMTTAISQQIESTKVCSICDKTSNESLVNLYTGKTKHSSTPIYDIVWKFMNNQSSERIQINDSIDSDLPGVCIECFDQINEYDLAIVLAEKLEEQIRAKLFHTENEFIKNRNAKKQKIEQLEGENNCEINELHSQDVESNESSQNEIIDLSDYDDDVIEVQT